MFKCCNYSLKPLSIDCPEVFLFVSEVYFDSSRVPIGLCVHSFHYYAGQMFKTLPKNMFCPLNLNGLLISHFLLYPLSIIFLHVMLDQSPRSCSDFK